MWMFTRELDYVMTVLWTINKILKKIVLIIKIVSMLTELQNSLIINGYIY